MDLERQENGQHTWRHKLRRMLKDWLPLETRQQYDLLVVHVVYLFNCVSAVFGPAREAIEHGVQLARGFPPRSKWTYGEVFHPAVVPQPLFRLAGCFFSLISLQLDFHNRLLVNTLLWFLNLIDADFTTTH